MALRVLLADESTSIKKVMQLALQDFGVEVKAVPVGLDVLPVAKSWKPDIIFVDVLLAKRSGYEVCTDIRSEAQLAQVPVVLIWSSFMDIDEKKASSCGATKRLEKPFDAETLRGLIKELVPNTTSNAIASYLSFPPLPDFVEKEPTPASQLASHPPQFSPTKMDEVDEPEDFSQIPLPKILTTPATPVTARGSSSPSGADAPKDSWMAGNLDRFKINFPTEDFSSLDGSYGSIDDAPISLSGVEHEVPLGDIDEIPGSTSRPQANIPSSVDPAVLEQILREQVQAVLQDIGWKIIPDIAERIVREEIQKLLKDAEKLS